MTLRGWVIGVLLAWAPTPPWAPPLDQPPAPPQPTTETNVALQHAVKRKPRKRKRVAPRFLALKVALRQLGVPYRWGGTSRRGFDCSGLMLYAWARAGVRLPRTTYGQIRTGRYVSSIRRAIRGDLLFPSSGHVQMYAGHGMVVEAPRTGLRVRVVPVRGSYLAIRRPR